MHRKILTLFAGFLFLTNLISYGENLHFDFDMTKPQPAYNNQSGYGYDRNTKAVTKNQRQPMFFSVKVPEGDYKITVTLGSKEYAGLTTLRSETRRMVVESLKTKKGELIDVTFNVNVHTTYINGKQKSES